jgi:hypothetical protein
LFKLVKLLAGLVGLAAFVWFGANVPLGSQTLFQHLQAIGRTRETQDLLDGATDKAKPLVDSVRRKLAHEATPGSGGPDAGAATAPADDIPEPDRQHLKKLLAGEAGERSSDPHSPHSTRRTPLR